MKKVKFCQQSRAPIDFCSLIATLLLVLHYKEELLCTARSRGGDFVLHIYYFAFQLTNYITFLKEDYYVGETICKGLIMPVCST